MDKIYDMPGETIYLNAMARGGGSNEIQGNILVSMDEVDFWQAMLFVAKIMEDPLGFDKLAHTINIVHTSVNLAKNINAPTDVSKKWATEDIRDTLEVAEKDCKISERKAVLHALVVKLYILAPEEVIESII